MGFHIVLIYALITILSFLLLTVTLLSYKKYKNIKLLLISFVFLVIFIRGVLLSIGLFSDPIEKLSLSGYMWGFDVVVLLFLYATYALKR